MYTGVGQGHRKLGHSQTQVHDSTSVSNTMDLTMAFL